MSHALPLLAIIVPCYNEEEILRDTNSKLQETLHGLKEEKQIAENSFIVYVDDGSKDSTWQIITGISSGSPGATGIKLSRNFGHQGAILAGLSHVRGKMDCSITIDADLQDDLNVIPEMISLYTKGFEIVYGVRQKREQDTFFKRITAITFYKLIRIMGVEIIYNHADFRLTGKRALEKLFEFKEVNLFLRGMLPLVGYPSTSVYYDRLERMAGETKYSFSKMLGFALDGITSFSVKPLRMVTFTGVAVFLLSIVLAIYSLYSHFFLGTVPGWTSITLPIYFISGIQILCIGILGEYLGKIYKEVKSRPRFIVEKVL